MSGIRTIDDIKARCVVDDITGCWNWRGGVTRDKNGYTQNPATSIPPGVMGNEKVQTTTGQRASWLLSGRRLNPGCVVYRSCLNLMCLCPDHLRSGTRSTALRFVADSGKHKGNPARAVINRRNAQSTVTPVETVRAAEIMFDRGEMQKTVAAALKIDKGTAKSIRDGVHPHSAGRIDGVRGSSVFSWRPA